ncbi:MAG: hypothetical protein IPF42_06310 [Candidatus Microthrix sp.]|nr:hypothetical protein [Candidatus Microthrix sp.]
MPTTRAPVQSTPGGGGQVGTRSLGDTSGQLPDEEAQHGGLSGTRNQLLAGRAAWG